jgi:hypothetical protein
MNDNDSPTYHLTFEDAVVIWLRRFAGEYQHRIAATYDVNPGRVNDVLKERTHVGSREEAERRAGRRITEGGPPQHAAGRSE